jgi:GntR family transcriptional regulator
MAETSYRRIADELRAAIQRGDYPPETTLPTQEQIAVIYGVHRNTVRAAVRELVKEGLVYTVRRRGTVVQEPSPLRLPVTRYRPTSTTPTSGPWEAACAAAGLVGTTDVLGVSWEQVTPAEAKMLEVEIPSVVVKRRNRMRVGDRVLQLQTTWLPGWVAPADSLLASPEKVHGGIYRGLAAAGHPIDPETVTEEVFPRMPVPEERAAFGYQAVAPVMDSRRTARDHEGRVVVVTRLVLSEHVSLVFTQAL